MRRIPTGERMRDGEMAGEVMALEGGLRARDLPLPHRPSTLSVIPEFLRQAWARGARPLAAPRPLPLARERGGARRVRGDGGVGVRGCQRPPGVGQLAHDPARTSTAASRRGRCARSTCAAAPASRPPCSRTTFAPASDILGLEYSPRLVGRRPLTGLRDPRRRSRRRPLPHAVGARDVPRHDGAKIPPASVDVVNSSRRGGLPLRRGRHGQRWPTRSSRVVRPGGLALIDSGRSGTTPPRCGRSSSGAVSSRDPRGPQLLRRPRPPDRFPQRPASGLTSTRWACASTAASATSR